MSPIVAPLSGNILGFMWERRRRLARGLGIAMLRGFGLAPCPWLFQVIVDVFVKDGNVRGILAAGIVFAGLMFLHFSLAVTGANEIARQVSQIMLELRGEIFYKLHLLNFAYLDRQKTGRLLSKYAFDTQNIEGVIFGVLAQVLPALLHSFIFMVIVVLLQWQMALILFFMVPALTVFYLYFQRKLRVQNEHLRLAREALTGTAGEMINALRLVRSLGEEQQVTSQVEQGSYQFARSSLQMIDLNSVFGTSLYVFQQIAALIVIAGGALFVLDGQMTIGTLFAFVTTLPIILQPAQIFASFNEQYFRGQASFHSVCELLECTDIEGWQGRQQLAQVTGDIRLEHVTFGYPGTTDLALKDFSLHLRPGERIALVGPSGSGKSTISHLILGLYKWQQGEVLIDGVPMHQVDMRWFRRQCAVVLQESILLSGSIAENIRFARPEATLAQVCEAARMANAEEFILRLPQGYDTPVGERGATLSGGQRQRISIARAILRDPRILILDEATSALDYESEHLVQEALRRLTQGRTVISIAHRLSTVRDADRLIVLRQGELVEEGSYAELVARGGVFADLLKMQAEPAREPAPAAPRLPVSGGVEPRR